MKAWVFVEGISDKLGLEALWADWLTRLRAKRYGVQVIPLDNKASLLRKFGARAAEKLVANAEDVVVGLPDLYPTVPFKGTDYEHFDAQSLKMLQVRLVRRALEETFGKRGAALETCLSRLFASMFKHDFEMLLLAATDALRKTLGTSETLTERWRRPVEDQNLERPPKRIVEELFRTKKNKSYRDTKDARSVLLNVTDLARVLRTPSGQCTCPEFVKVLRWLSEKLGEPCCNLDWPVNRV